MNSVRAVNTAWASPYVGIPYADRGRGFDGADCWGLVVLVYRDRFMIDLPTYDGFYASAAEREEIAAIVAFAAESPCWSRIDDPEPGDVLFFRRGRHDSHAGLWLAPGLMLHMAADDCAKIERCDGPRWARRLTGIYRWTRA